MFVDGGIVLREDRVPTGGDPGTQLAMSELPISSGADSILLVPSVVSAVIVQNMTFVICLTIDMHSPFCYTSASCQTTRQTGCRHY
jgi:hypothetical protein